MSPTFCSNAPARLYVQAHGNAENSTNQPLVLGGRESLVSDYRISNQGSVLTNGATLINALAINPSNFSNNNAYDIQVPYLSFAYGGEMPLPLSAPPSSSDYEYMNNGVPTPVPSYYYSTASSLVISKIIVGSQNQALAFAPISGTSGNGTFRISLSIGPQVLDNLSSFTILSGCDIAGFVGSILQPNGVPYNFPNVGGILSVDTQIFALSTITNLINIHNSGVTVAPSSTLVNIALSSQQSGSLPITLPNAGNFLAKIAIATGVQVFDTTIYRGGLIGAGNRLEGGTSFVQTGNPSPYDPSLSFSAVLDKAFSLSPGDSVNDILMTFAPPCPPCPCPPPPCSTSTATTTSVTAPPPSTSPLLTLIPAGTTVNSDISFVGMNFSGNLTLPKIVIGPNSPLNSDIQLLSNLFVNDPLELSAGFNLLAGDTLGPGTLSILNLVLDQGVTVSVGENLPYPIILTMAVTAGNGSVFPIGMAFVSGQSFPSGLSWSGMAIPSVSSPVMVSLATILGGPSVPPGLGGLSAGSMIPAGTVVGGGGNGVSAGPGFTFPIGGVLTNTDPVNPFTLTFGPETTFGPGFNLPNPLGLPGGFLLKRATEVFQGTWLSNQTPLLPGMNPQTFVNTSSIPNSYLQTQFGGQYTMQFETFTPSVAAHWYNPATGVAGPPTTPTGATRSYYLIPPNSALGSLFPLPQGTLFFPDQSNPAQVSTPPFPFPYAFLVDGPNSGVAPYASSWFNTITGTSVNFPSGSYTFSSGGVISGNDISVLVSGTPTATPNQYNYYPLQETIYMYAARTLDVTIAIPVDAIANLDDMFTLLSFDMPVVAMSSFILTNDYTTPNVGFINWVGSISTPLTITDPYSVTIPPSGTYTFTGTATLAPIIQITDYLQLYGSTSALTLTVPSGGLTTTGPLIWQSNFSVPSGWSLNSGTATTGLVTTSGQMILSDTWDLTSPVTSRQSVLVNIGSVIPNGPASFPFTIPARVPLPPGVPISSPSKVINTIRIPQRLILQEGSILLSGSNFQMGSIYSDGLYIPGPVSVSPQTNGAPFTLFARTITPEDMYVSSTIDNLRNIAACLTPP